MRFRLGAASAAFIGIGFVGIAGAQTNVLPEIVITAPTPIVQPRAPVAVAPPPGTLPILEYVFSPVTVVLEDEIRRSPANTVGDLLANYPGITATGFIPGAASRPIIRGLDNYRIRIQENGIGVQDVSAFGEDHAVPINPLIANQIEVIRGPATLRWGSTAIGGVVSIDNDRIPTVPNRALTVDLRSAFSAVDQGAQGAAVVQASNDQYAVYFDAFGRRAQDYYTPLGRQANSYQRSEGQSVGATKFFDGGYIGFNVSRIGSLYGIPGEGAAENVRIDLEQVKLMTKGEYRPQNPSIDAIRFWFGMSDYRHDEIANVNEIGSTFKNREQEGRVEIQFAPRSTMWGPVQTALGFQINNQNLSTEGEAGTLLAPAQTLSAATYLFNEVKLSDVLRFQAAGRVETVNIDGTGATVPGNFLPPPAALPLFAAKRDFVPGSVSVGLLRDLPWMTVGRINAQYAERAPKAAELFSRGPHEATGTFEIGDPSLTKEAAASFEIGWRRARGDFRFDATLFHTRYNGFIFKRFTGNTCDDDFATCVAGPGAELLQIVFAQRDANFTGFEAIGQLDVLPIYGGTFGIDAQYDIVDARFADGTYVPRIPPMRVGGGLFWRDGNWLIRTNYLHAFRQDHISANETETAGYNLVKAEISYTKRFTGNGGPREMTIGLVGNNLLNDDIRSHVSFNKNEVLAPGRDVRLFVNTRF